MNPSPAALRRRGQRSGAEAGGGAVPGPALQRWARHVGTGRNQQQTDIAMEPWKQDRPHRKALTGKLCAASCLGEAVDTDGWVVGRWQPAAEGPLAVCRHWA